MAHTTGSTVAMGDLFSSMGSLASDMDFTEYLNLGQSFLMKMILYNFHEGYVTSDIVIKAAIMIGMLTCLASAAHVIVFATEWSVNFEEGFYFDFYYESDEANQAHNYELAIYAAWYVWAFVVIIMSFVGAYFYADAVDVRLAEAAADSINLENAITWGKAIRAVTNIMMVTVGVVASAFALSDTAQQLIGYIDEYAPYWDDEATRRTQTNNIDNFGFDVRDNAGTGAREDILFSHFITSFYTFAVYSVMTIGAFVFGYWHMSFDDKYELDCTFITRVDNNRYGDAQQLLASITGYQSCAAVIEQLFRLEDLNNDGFVTRCEDAQFQNYFGSSTAYATKFSGMYDLAAAKNICKENFPLQVPETASLVIQ